MLELHGNLNSLVKDKDGLKQELSRAVASLEDERKAAETRLTMAKSELEARIEELSVEISTTKNRESRLREAHQT